MSTSVNIYIFEFQLFSTSTFLNFKFYEVVSPLYMKKYQVLSGCYPFFYICPVFFFIVGKYSKFLLLRSRFVPFFMDSKNSKYSPLPHRFKWIFHGFLLASLFAFSLRFSLFALCSFFCSASVR